LVEFCTSWQVSKAGTGGAQERRCNSIADIANWFWVRIYGWSGVKTALAAQLKSQHARGARYFVGNALSALDIYWTAFANLLDPLPNEQCPMPEAWRPAFVATDPVVKQALGPQLLELRARIFR